MEGGPGLDFGSVGVVPIEAGSGRGKHRNPRGIEEGVGTSRGVGDAQEGGVLPDVERMGDEEDGVVGGR